MESLSVMATISSLFMWETIPDLFFCSYNFILSHSSLGLEVKNLVEQPFGFDFVKKTCSHSG